jgi:hypothetical protein
MRLSKVKKLAQGVTALQCKSWDLNQALPIPRPLMERPWEEWSAVLQGMNNIHRDEKLLANTHKCKE